MRGSRRQTAGRDRLQDHVPERVLAAAQLHPSAGGDARGPLAATRVWVAVSPTRLYAFAARDDDVGDLLAVWDRDATTVRRAVRLTGTRVSLRVGPNGQPVELDAPRWRGQHAFFRYLLDPARTA